MLYAYNKIVDCNVYRKYVQDELDIHEVEALHSYGIVDIVAVDVVDVLGVVVHALDVERVLGVVVRVLGVVVHVLDEERMWHEIK